MFWGLGTRDRLLLWLWKGWPSADDTHITIARVPIPRPNFYNAPNETLLIVRVPLSYKNFQFTTNMIDSSQLMNGGDPFWRTKICRKTISTFQVYFSAPLWNVECLRPAHRGLLVHRVNSLAWANPTFDKLLHGLAWKAKRATKVIIKIIWHL
jgi:hypothetical protein